MHSLFLVSLLPYVAAVPLGNIYNAVRHPIERGFPVNFTFPAYSAIPTATDTFAPVAPETLVPIVTRTVSSTVSVTSTVSGIPLQTLQVSSTVQVGYGLAPRSVVPSQSDSLSDSDHNIMNILPRQGYGSGPTGASGLPGTHGPFPGATGLPHPPNSSPSFPAASPSGKPSPRPFGTGSIPLSTGVLHPSVGTPSVEFPHGKPALPEPSGQSPSY